MTFTTITKIFLKRYENKVATRSISESEYHFQNTFQQKNVTALQSNEERDLKGFRGWQGAFHTSMFSKCTKGRCFRVPGFPNFLCVFFQWSQAIMDSHLLALFSLVLPLWASPAGTTNTALALVSKITIAETADPNSPCLGPSALFGEA